MKILVADDHELFLKGLELILHDFDPAVELVFAKKLSEVFDQFPSSGIFRWF